MDPDSLVATRSRRANAGANLKKLIEIEELSLGNNIVYTGDDENVELLFQEDENDGEFEESHSEGEEEEEDEEEGEEGEAEAEAPRSDAESDKNVNSDEMLSDSDLSASDNDDSEGERDLQKREREKKRKKKLLIIPAIKKPRKQEPKPKPVQPKHSELLLTNERRASSRKSALKNKEVLVQKLMEDESRRAALTPVVRVKERKLTQEERLEQAKETERENVKSLHSFLEQEIVKKERQKWLFQQRRLKLQDVVRLTSKLSFISPLDEIKDARNVFNFLDKRRKGRRKRGEVVEEILVPGAVDTSLPYYRQEMERKRQEELIELETAQNEHAGTTEVGNTGPETEVGKTGPETEDKVVETGEEPKHEKVETAESGKADSEEDAERDAEQDGFTEKEEEKESGSIEKDEESTESKDIVSEMSPESNESLADRVKLESDRGQNEEVEEKETENDTVETGEEKAEKEEILVSEPEKHEPESTEKIELPEIKESDEFDDESVDFWKKDYDGSIFEGPPQLVARNYVSLIEFENERLLPLASHKVKMLLFGEGANSGASRRLRDVKTILKSSLRLDNPYSLPKEEKEDDLMKPVTEIDEEDIMFEVLRRVPRLGTKEIYEEFEEDNLKEEATAVEIRTEAPSGLYLPNENKKLCLINGKEVRYFDPATGIPYDNKDGYKIIKSIEAGNVPWLSLGKDQNAYGEVEIYINRREGARHAKGVPEGFDGF